MTIAAGRHFAGLRIDGEIGRGGMGVVYRAYDPALSRPAAVKLVRAELSADLLFKLRFDRERKAQAGLDHPNIVDVYSSGESEGRLFVAMRLIDGPSLADLLLDGPLPPEKALRILTPIAAALDHAHARGPVHRDLKPQNILLDADGRPFLTDFGLAWVPGDSRMTTTGAFMGTTAYASPEQLRGQSVGPTSDVYSLACVLYECLSGAVPFPRDTGDAQVSADAPLKLSALDRGLPATIDEVVRTGMASAPSQRYHSASALIDAATQALSPAPRPVRRAPSERRARTRILGPTFAGALVALLAFGLLLGYLLGGEDTAAGKERSAGNGAVSLAFPDDWRRTRNGAAIEGLRFEKPIHLRDSAGGATLSAGLVAAAGKLLLPGSFLRTLPRLPAQDQAVQTAAGATYRYPGLRTTAGAADVYVLPTSAGVATIVCRVATGEGRERCGRIASTLRLRGKAEAWPLGPSVAYGRLLDRALGKLQRRRGAGYRDLNEAATPGAQAAAVADVRAAFEGASAQLAAAEITPQTADGNATVVAALERTASAYADLASAARSGDSSAYDAARRAVGERETAVRRAVRALRRLGYEPG